MTKNVQGPGQDTTPAFWKMIWQYNVRVVVMLTNVVEGTDRFTSIKCNKGRVHYIPLGRSLDWVQKKGDQQVWTLAEENIMNPFLSTGLITLVTPRSSETLRCSCLIEPR